jgi:hypothetical protein
MKETCMN